MNKNEETTCIYTGSAIIAQPLINSLDQLDITPIIRDDNQSGILSGFAEGIPGQIRMYIRNEEVTIAKDVLDAFNNSLEA